jgi:hypothetical protein
MEIRFICENCGSKYIVDSKHSGKKGKCKKCGSPFIVPNCDENSNESKGLHYQGVAYNDMGVADFHADSDRSNKIKKSINIGHREKFILMIWMGLITICMLFPPYTYTIIREKTSNPRSIESIVRYGFLIFSPPEPRIYPVHDSQHYISKYLDNGIIKTTEKYNGFSCWRLILEILAASFGCLTAILYTRLIPRRLKVKSLVS